MVRRAFMEILIIVLLILLNGILAMSEAAVISARKSRLQQLSNEGSANAQAALELSKSPNRFLSTIQIGITLVGIFSGAFGGATIAETMSNQLNQVTIIAPYSETIALIIVVTIITYLTLIIGELVPKRLALNSPEKIAATVARPMIFLSSITSPVVTLLSNSTDWFLSILHIKQPEEMPVSEEEIKMLIREGARTGVFNLAERDIVERTFKLSDKKVNTIMTPRREIVWLNIESTFHALRNKITKNPHSNFPVCANNLDKVLGVINTEDILRNFLLEEKIDLQKSLHKPLFIPETLEAIKVLELFKKSGVHMALVIDEYGNILGILSLTDILEEIVGDIPTINAIEEQAITKREDGSYLIDGLVTIEKFKDFFQIKKLPDEKSGDFQTIGGFVMDRLDRIPVSGDNFEWESFRFEVIDMDKNRVDKVLVARTDGGDIMAK